ncbi:hypothetical protein PIB30_006102 [Stylosanthes scabra]|uniref:Aminotransferase-like plant mobile domain-containing protein n=1 Tax=Stylosanthes scabra TaxID=79078 RepID=A0ABU6W283_9FABA|nr:hypothetical protein [Stylosanthes scabra]
MCRGVNFKQKNLGGCASLLLSWAYHRIHACRPHGNFDEMRFPLVERWRGFRQPRDSFGPRVRMWRMILNNVDHQGGKDEWYPTFLRGWYDMWRDKAQSHLELDMAVGGVLPSRQWFTRCTDMVQPEDGELPAVHPRVPRRRRPPAGRGRGRHTPAGSPAREEAPQQGVDADRSQDFEFGMTDADFLSLGLAGPSHTTPDT